MGQKISYCILFISLLSIDQFSHFLLVHSVRNLLVSGMHTTPIMSLHYHAVSCEKLLYLVAGSYEKWLSTRE